MALFGKKKAAATPAPQPNPEDDIQVMGGDADETGLEDDDGGQVIDFDAIAQDLNAHDNDSTMDAFLGRNADASDDTSHGAADVPDATNLDDEIDFGTNFDAGTPAIPVATETNPFAETPDFGNAPDIEPIVQAPDVQTPDVQTHAPPMTYTAPILTSDLAANGSAPAMKKSVPLPMLLGAVGLLAALGGVGYWVTSAKPETPAPVVAANPPSETIPSTPGAANDTMPSGAVAAPGGPSGAVNQGIAVDGVPITPGAVVRQAPIGSVAPNTALGTAPATALGGANANVTPAVKAQLKALWNKGAEAKHSGDFAGARAAWTQMQNLRPSAAVKSAIDKLPPAKR